MRGSSPCRGPALCWLWLARGGAVLRPSSALGLPPAVTLGSDTGLAQTRPSGCLWRKWGTALALGSLRAQKPLSLKQVGGTSDDRRKQLQLWFLSTGPCLVPTALHSPSVRWEESSSPPPQCRSLIAPLPFSGPQFTQMLSKNGPVASSLSFGAWTSAPQPRQGEGPG